jgi:hypothetical protein
MSTILFILGATYVHTSGAEYMYIGSLDAVKVEDKWHYGYVLYSPIDNPCSIFARSRDSFADTFTLKKEI